MNEIPSIVAGPGLRVGEYVLDEKIGQGAFGEVWKAHHRAWTEQLAAVKIPSDPAYLRQLQSEGFSLHRLSHPNVLRVIGFDPAASPPYMMTELVDGPTLRELLQRVKLTVPQAVAIARQILAGLTYAHRHGVVHGDLKPENVLVEKIAEESEFREEGTIKLADFGVGLVARAAAGSGSSSHLNNRSGIVSTVAYIAPEQRDGAPPDNKSDLFACGVILFELLTGERPGGAESPSDLDPAIPRTLDEIFRHAYARRDRRYASAQEMLTALDGVAASLPAVVKPPPSRPVRTERDDDIIGFKPDDDEAAPPRPMVIDVAEPAPIAKPPVSAPPPPLRPAAAKESPLPEPILPATALPTPSRTTAKMSQRGVIVIDELARKPLRSANDMRELFRRLYLTRAMEPGEVANLRLRLDQWAESVGGLPGFGERVEITEALDCPFHRVVVVTEYDQQDGPPARIEEAVILGNSAAAQDCGQTIESSDYMLSIHLSTGAFPIALLDMIGVPVLRSALGNLLTAAKSQAAGRPIIRQELKLERANVLSLRYTFEGADHGVCFAGSSLKVVAPITPVTKMRDDLLKRAASLLDTENIGAGINELRQMFLTPNPAQPRAERMLIALRAKLSAAYVELARATAGGFGIFESLDYSRRATELLPSSEGAVEHENRVRKKAFWMHFTPGLGIGVIFALIAVFNRPFSWGYVAAAVGATIAGVASWYKLRSNLTRTDAAFCHACLLPLAIAAVLAITLKEPKNVTNDIACLMLLIVVVVVDRMVLRKNEHWLFRSHHQDALGGSPLETLNQVQTMLQPDWERLREYYVALPPLYKHASANIIEVGSASDAAGNDETGAGLESPDAQ